MYRSAPIRLPHELTEAKQYFIFLLASVVINHRRASLIPTESADPRHRRPVRSPEEEQRKCTAIKNTAPFVLECTRPFVKYPMPRM